MKTINITARLIAFFLFAIGTVLFLWYYNSNQTFIAQLAAGFVLFAVLIGFISLIAVIFCAFKSSLKQPYIVTIILLLLNIPIAIGYVHIVYTSMDEAKDTFINGTKNEITDITIYGCGENKHVQKLFAGESVVLRFKLNKPCSVGVKFQLKGKTIFLSAFGTDREVEWASWSTFIIEKDIIYLIDAEALKKYDFK